MSRFYLELVVKKCPLDRFFTNPYHIAGSTLARLIVNGVTLTWAAIVLVTSNALVSSGARYAFITEYVHENTIAGVLAFVSIVNLLILWHHLQPTPMRNSGYVLLSFAWGFAFFAVVFRSGPVQATAASTTAWISLVALYALLDARPARLTCGVADDAAATDGQ